MRFFQIGLILLFPLSVFAQKQTFEQYKSTQQTKYQNFKSAQQKEYDAYRKKINADYAKTMSQKWTLYKSYAAIKKPKDQDPPKPAVKMDKTPPTLNEINCKSVISIVPYDEPEPIVPISEPLKDDKPQFKFTFHGTSCAVHLNDALKYTLSAVSEPAATAMWNHLSNSAYDDVIADCLRLRDELQLGDWGYINLVQTLTQTFYGSKQSNEAVIMQMYILTQSGYSTRVARTSDRFYLLVPLKASLYGYSYLDLEGQKYWIFGKSGEKESFYIFEKEFPNEQIPSLRLTKSPNLDFQPAPQRTIASARYPSMKATFVVNKNLIDFYNEYPLSTSWDYYSAASLSDETKASLYPVLKREIAGKSVKDAANMLLNFVQTAFSYQTDGDQFGYERPLFGDETLFYPYSDCEDRSIFYSILVRELLGLEAVLLYYPGHLATAVVFPDNQYYGWHFRWKDKVYTICDPTYTGADIGDCMPNYQTVSPEVIQIE